MSLKPKLNATHFFCESCRTRDAEKLPEKANTVNFSEAKEEETECYYCASRGLTKQAEVLFNGYPSCRECRKSKNVMNFVTKSASSNQKIVVTQVAAKDGVKEGDVIMNISENTFKPQHPKVMKSVDFTGMNLNPLGQSPNSYRQERYNPLLMGEDFDDPNLMQLKAEYLSPRLASPGMLADPLINPTKLSPHHARGQTSVDFYKLMKSQDLTPQVTTRSSDPKVVDFFAKVNQKGIKTHKSNLLYSGQSDKFSGKKFHEKCDQKGPLLIIIFLNSGYMFGGFMTKELNPKLVDVSDPFCGLFSTIDGKTIDFYSVSQGKINYTPNGVSFGNPILLSINFDNLNQLVCNFELVSYDPFGRKIPFKVEKGMELSSIITDIAVYKLK